MTPRLGALLAGCASLLAALFASRRASAPVDALAPQEPAGSGPVQAPQPGVLRFRAWALARWGERPGSPQNITADKPGEHREGRAWDLMTLSLEHGQRIIDELTASGAELARRAGVMYMIWNRQIWRSYAHGGAPAGTWGPYSGVNPHTDHVHFSFSRAGAAAQTSLYSGGIA